MKGTQGGAHSASAPLLELRGASKSFPGVLALDSVDMQVEAGEVVAVIGENGAGKSTLINIIGGLLTPDEGEIYVGGERQRFSGAADSIACGISIIHQELHLADNLSLAENVFLGREPLRNRRLGWIDRKAMEASAETLLARVGLQRGPRESLARLSLGERQLVEIAKALSIDARVVVMDEPTAPLSAADAERLFEVIEELRKEAIGIVYVSHRLSEITRLADRVVVLRDGARVAHLRRNEVDEEKLVELMVGRSIETVSRERRRRSGEPSLKVAGLRLRPGAPSIDFELGKGEILGLAGLVGAGRTALAEALFGLRPASSGNFEIDGVAVRIDSPADAVAAGLALVPEDRKSQGLILLSSVSDNIALPAAGLRPPLSRRRPERERSTAQEQSQRLGIKLRSVDDPVATLSGGNQQKTVLGKWLAMGPRILLLDEPTRGIDVRSRHDIYALIRALSKKGVSVLFISSDMEEILLLADRVLVMRDDAIVGSLEASKLNESAILRLATGTSAAA